LGTKKSLPVCVYGKWMWTLGNIPCQFPINESRMGYSWVISDTDIP
jgi:hypothetical protein